MFENKTKSVTVSSTNYRWTDGSVDTMVINDLEGEEEEIQGLHTIKFGFNCKLTVSA
jgi:hypothetical protein